MGPDASADLAERDVLPSATSAKDRQNANGEEVTRHRQCRPAVMPPSHGVTIKMEGSVRAMFDRSGLDFLAVAAGCDDNRRPTGFRRLDGLETKLEKGCGKDDQKQFSHSADILLDPIGKTRQTDSPRSPPQQGDQMNDPQERNGSDSRTSRAPGRSKSTAGGIAIAIVLLAYSFAAPALNARFGWNLPQISGDSESQLSPEIAARKGFDRDSRDLTVDRPGVVADALRDTASDSPKSAIQRADSDPPKDRDATSSSAQNSRATQPTSTSRHPNGSDSGRSSNRSETQRGPPSTAEARSSSSRTNSTPIDATSTTSGSTQRDAAAGADLRFGLLREVSVDRFLSPAGLLYTPGSAEGHRLEHVRRHTQNDPGRPGSHGVFDGGMEGMLLTIDQAYDRAKKGQRTTKKTDQGRTIYTVDMGERIGYVGGRDGGRRRNPMARRVRLVLEGNRVITAYPM